MEENKNTKKEIRTIKRGNDLIDLDKYIGNLQYNFEDWVNKVKVNGKKLNEEQINQVREAYRDMLNGYNDGTLTAGLGNVTNDSTGKRTNNPDKKGFDAYGISQNFFDNVYWNQQVYTPPTKGKFNGSKAWNDYLGTQTIDYDLFKQMSQNDQNDYLQKLVQSYIGSLKGDDYEDYDSNYEQNLINSFKQAISDPELTAKERMDLSQYGIDLSKFYKVKEPEPEKTEEDLLNEEVAKRQQEEQLDKTRMEIRKYDWSKELDSLENKYSMRDFSRVGDYRTDLNKLKIDEDTWNKVLNPDKIERASIFSDYAPSDNLYNGNPTKDFTNRSWALKVGDKEYRYFKDEFNKLSKEDQVLAAQKAYALDWLDSLTDDQKLAHTIKSSRNNLFNNWFIIDSNPNNSGYITIMDRTGNHIGRVRVADIFATNSTDKYKDDYVQYHLNNKNIPMNKEGGVLKAQFGDILFERTDTKQNIKNLSKEKEERKEKDLIDKAKRTGRTLEQYKRDKTKVKDDLSGTDIARLTAIGADLASLGLSVSGVGSVPGALVGAAGTFTNMGADIAEGRSAWDVVKNLGIGLGLDIAGAIPVAGALAKAPKLVKTFRALAKSSPYILGAMSTLENKEVTDSVGRILKGEDWTHDDLKNLSYFVSFLTGTARGGIASGQKRLAKKYANQTTSESQALNTDKGIIKVGDKEGEIKLGDYKKLKETKSLKEAQQILSDLKIKGFENASLKGSTKVPFMDQKVNKSSFMDEKSTIYDTSNLEGAWWLRNNNDRISIENQLNGSRGFMNKLFAPKSQTNNSTVTQSTNNIPFSIRQKGLPDLAFKYLNPDKTPVIDLRAGITSSMSSKVRNDKLRDVLKFVKDNQDKRISTKGLGQFLHKYNTSPHNGNTFVPAILNYTPRGAIYKDNKLYVFKQGGSVQKASEIINNLKKNTNILKGQNGITPKWFDDLLGIQTVLKYKGQDISSTNMPNASSRNTMGVSGYNGYGEHIYDNKARYDALEAYKKSGNRGKDIQNYFTKHVANASSMTDDELVANYNAKAKQIRDFWNGNVDYNNTNASNHNDIHLQLFESRNLEKGDPNTGNVGWDDANKARAGRSTWARIMDISEADDPNTIYDINIGNRILRVYKKANGDIAPVTYPTSKQNPNQTPLADPSQIKKVGGVDTSGHDPIPDLINDYRIKSSTVPLMSSLGRLAGTLGTNVLNYPTMREGMRGYNIGYNQKQGRTLGNLAYSNFARNQGLDAITRAELNYTPDAALNFAIRAEAQKMKWGWDEKGFLADNQKIETTSDEERKINWENSDKRIDAVNKNKALNYDTRRNLAQLLSDYRLKQWNAIAGWSAEQQGRYEQDLTNKRNFIQDAMYSTAQQKLENATYAAKERLRQAIRANQNNPTWDMYDSDEYKEYERISRETAQQLRLEQNKNLGNFFGIKYDFDPGYTYKNK